MKLRIKSKWTFSDGIILFIIIMPIIDCINGYFMKTSLSVIGPLYRLLMMLLAFYIVIRWGNTKTIMFTLGISSYFFLHDILFIVFDRNNNSMSIITNRTLKYIYLILVAEALRVLVKRKILNMIDIESILSYLSWLYPILLIFPKLIGARETSMYTNSGYKGFYYSGNALSIAMVFCLFVAVNFLHRKPCLQNAVRAVLCLVVQLLIGAKTNYIFAVLILGFFVVKSIGVTKQKNMKTLIMLGVLVIAGIVSIKCWFSNEIAAILARQNYLFSAYNNNWFRYLTSNRSIRIEDQLHLFNSNLFYIMFGMGYRQNLTNNFVEMDYFDLLFRYGIIITIVLIIYYFYFIKKAFCEKKDSLILFLIMLAFAMLAGHVFCEAMSGTLLALVIAHINCNDKSVELHRSCV